MNKQSGFLLSYLKYGENDAVLHCFTQESGYQSFFVRGIYSVKNKKKAYLLPLNELSLTLSSHTKNTSMPSISKIEKKDTAHDLWDIKQSSVIFFVADFLNQTLKNEARNESLYEEVRKFKENLYAGNLQSHFLFLIKVLPIFGIAPMPTEGKFLCVEKGVFQKESSLHTLDEEISSVWKKILMQDTDLTMEPKHRKKLMDSILLFYKFHFPDFHTPKSLVVIHQLFE